MWNGKIDSILETYNGKASKSLRMQSKCITHEAYQKKIQEFIRYKAPANSRNPPHLLPLNYTEMKSKYLNAMPSKKPNNLTMGARGFVPAIAKRISSLANIPPETSRVNPDAIPHPQFRDGLKLNPTPEIKRNQDYANSVTPTMGIPPSLSIAPKIQEKVNDKNPFPLRIDSNPLPSPFHSISFPLEFSKGEMKPSYSSVPQITSSAPPPLIKGVPPPLNSKDQSSNISSDISKAEGFSPFAAPGMPPPLGPKGQIPEPSNALMPQFFNPVNEAKK